MFSSMIADLCQSLGEGHDGSMAQDQAAEVPRLHAEFQKLMTDDAISNTLDRQNKMHFRKNLRAFLFAVRGFLNTS